MGVSTTQHRWWTTAQSASAAAAQMFLWVSLLGVSAVGIEIDGTLQWWLASFLWAVGLIASGATFAVRSGLAGSGRGVRPAAPMTPAGAVSWGLTTAAVGAAAICALAVLLTTRSLVALVVMMLASAAGLIIAVHGARRPIERPDGRG